MTLHTNDGVTLANTTQTGAVVTTNCDVDASLDNSGCSIVDLDSADSFDEAFDKNGGGVFATEYASEAIKIWFFPRSGIPADVSGPSPSPSGWVTSNAVFASTEDQLDSHFCELRIILNIDFCGDWAGNSEVWEADPASSYVPTYNGLVENSPESFTEAYWAVNSLKVWNPSQGLGSKKRSNARRHGGAVLPE